MTNAPSTASEVTFRAIQRHDAIALVRLAETAASASWTEAFVLWKYFQNPAGPIYGCCAEAESQLAGFYGNSPVRIKLDDHVVTGAQALDAMVLPEARRRGVFVRMARRTYRSIDADGLRPLYGIPNPISRAGLVKRLGWTYPGEIPVWVKIVSPGAVGARSGLEGPKAWLYRTILHTVHLTRPPQSPREEGIRVRELSAFDHRFDQLWDNVSPGFDVAVVRDGPYLTWRYVQNPLQRSLILAAERGEELLGYVVLSFRDADEKGVLAIADLLLRPSEMSAGVALLHEATRRALHANCGQLQCWMLPQHSFYTRLLGQSGFVYSRSRLLPGIFRQTASFITRLPEGATMAPDPTDLGNWFLTMGDQDYY
ncbi:MAG: GNAT family N-acetyltransferase [Thiohalospira sp.]